MSYMDAHMAVRLEYGLQMFCDPVKGYARFVSCLTGLVPDASLPGIYNGLFPLENGVRVPRCAVRTDYNGIIDGRIAQQPSSPAPGPTHFPAVIIDLVDEKVKSSFGGNRRAMFTSTIEVMVVAKTKSELRALYTLIQELVIDSMKWFKLIGYSNMDIESGADIRPIEALGAGLHPNFLGLMQRYMRVTGILSRVTDQLFDDTDPPLHVNAVRVHHFDALDVANEPGLAVPRDQ